MAYLNNIYGNAAYTGFIKGALAGRKITDSVAANYAPLKAAALAFAAQLDSLIVFDALVTTAAGITQLAQTTNAISANEQWRAGLLHDIAAAVLTGSYTNDATQADYTGLAAACFAAWTNLVAGVVAP